MTARGQKLGAVDTGQFRDAFFSRRNFSLLVKEFADITGRAAPEDEEALLIRHRMEDVWALVKPKLATGRYPLGKGLLLAMNKEVLSELLTHAHGTGDTASETAPPHPWPPGQCTPIASLPDQAGEWEQGETAMDQTAMDQTLMDQTLMDVTATDQTLMDVTAMDVTAMDVTAMDVTVRGTTATHREPRVSQVVTVHSSSRAEGTANSYVVPLPTPLGPAGTATSLVFRYVSFDAPVPRFNVTAQNNRFYFAEDDDPMITITIKPGRWDFHALIKTLERQMTDMGRYRYSVEVDATSSTLMFKQSAGKHNGQLHLINEQVANSMASLLGFRQLDKRGRSAHSGDFPPMTDPAHRDAEMRMFLPDFSEDPVAVIAHGDQLVTLGQRFDAEGGMDCLTVMFRADLEMIVPEHEICLEVFR
jgi:hypothetical protein